VRRSKGQPHPANERTPVAPAEIRYDLLNMPAWIADGIAQLQAMLDKRQAFYVYLIETGKL
jgi:hypothetical protein